jgi:hypothetical protein
MLMKGGRFWLAVLIGGVAGNILDMAVYGFWLGPKYMAHETLFRHGLSPWWFVFADFVAVFIFAWLFDKVSGSFGSKAMDGAKAGLFLGVFANVPSEVLLSLMFDGYSYTLSLLTTAYGVVWYVMLGTVVAAVMKKSTAVLHQRIHHHSLSTSPRQAIASPKHRMEVETSIHDQLK